MLANVESEQYELIEVTVDSGAAEAVTSPEVLNQWPTLPTESSRNGEQFVAANGSVIENEGERFHKLLKVAGMSPFLFPEPHIEHLIQIFS